MEDGYEFNQTFKHIDYRTTPLPKGEYEDCEFSSCNFSEAELSGIHFIDCRFIACNLSVAKLVKTVFRDVLFRECKMMGLAFYNCDDFGLSFRFEQCILDHSF